ncbi:QsdR family transcriptional regulator [Nocardioides limicola]|uniref:QsdR family transcriptional regulator n=1 Tax=Nocardioides limicola TaxID=2803368 RepID=UPI00193C7FEF|nr:QsdR family transcriptional regulator [Nocardioides sp. DJM-14]
MTDPTKRGPGRPSAASRDAVLDAARAAFRAGVRVDARAIAAQVGISRTTIFRWFGPREELVAEVLAAEFRSLMHAAERDARGTGAERILDVMSTLSSHLARSEPYAAYLQAERLDALRIITASNGKVQSGAIAVTRDLLSRVVDEDGYRPRLPLDVLAFTVVRLVEAFLYTHYEGEEVALNSDLTQLRAVLSTLLHESDVPPSREGTRS